MSRFRPALAGCMLVVLVGALVVAPPPAPAAGAGCAAPRAKPANAALVRKALLAGDDMLGKKLLADPNGPTYAGVRGLLAPIRYARGRAGARQTESGSYYVVFASPLSLYGEKAFALHVADGSEIVTRRSDGPGVTIEVGTARERYGSCERRLDGPRLARGYLPILRTSYVDAAGARYRQESFAGRIPGVRSLVSFVRIAVDARRSRTGTAVVRLVPSDGSATRLVTDGRGSRDGSSVRYGIRGTAVIHAAWVHRPTAGVVADASTYDVARRAVARFWDRQLARGATFDVPERRVMDAQRNVLVQQRILTWRYSVGNNYEELSFAEALDAAQVMAAYGHGDVSRAILHFALKRLPERYTNWRAGAVLAAAATHVALTGDTELAETEAHAFKWILERLERQIRRPGGTGLLEREAFSSDIARRVAALHGQAVAWQGLRSMGRTWARRGRDRLATRADEAAGRLGFALRAAVRASATSLEDGSLFVPAALLDDTRPFDRLTASREGSYWNLVMPYALASGVFDPNGPTSRGIWRYMERHGSMLLGLVRADADRLYGAEPYPAGGIDQVYGLDLARFLADADLPDQLVLSLYGTLAAAMTPDTFVSGEAVTVAPLGGLRYRSMYLPPNGGTNTTLLETLRLALVHERRDACGAPAGLELAFATPRGWLESGKTIRVRDAPTSFGPVSYEIRRRRLLVSIEVDAPVTPSLRLRLRLPAGDRIADVRIAGRLVQFDPTSGTIHLSGRGRSLRVVARLRG